MTIEEQLEFLKKGAVDLIRQDDLRKKLERSVKNGNPLRVKLGLDPTAPDIHVGHTVVIRKLKAFQREAVGFVDGVFRNFRQIARQKTQGRVRSGQSVKPLG